MTTFGLTDTGFVAKTQDDVLADLDADLREELGSQINLTSGVLFRISRIFSEPITELWELGSAIYAAWDPDAATGDALKALCTLTGTEQDAASASTAQLTLTGTPTTAVASGSRAKITDTEIEFATDDDATIALATSWANTTGYTLGQFRTNASRIYVVITAGTSAGSGGPTTTAADITDGTVHWRYVGEGTGYVQVDSTAVETGPTEADSGTITTISTAVGGWSSVMNLLDADLGTDLESDESLRIKRDEELATAGTSTPDAIRADLLQVDDVTTVTVFHNDTDTTDVDGMPPHSVEALVQGGDDQDIWDQLLQSVAAGIETTGTEDGTATDAEGNVIARSFSRPAPVPIYVAVTLTFDPLLYPTDGDDQVIDAIIAYGDAQKCGKDSVSSGLIGAVFAAVPGVLDIVHMYIGIAPTPVTTTTIAIAKRELATYDTSRVTVSSSSDTP